jgi:hypothetical protein
LIVMNERGCYCGLWDKDPSYLVSRGVPPGYCGHCQRCGEPGHTRHFPGGVPYTGCWCDKHYRRLSWLHPLACPGMAIYVGLFLALIASTFIFGD